MKTTLIHTHRTQSKKKPNDVTPPPLILGQSRLGESKSYNIGKKEQSNDETAI